MELKGLLFDKDGTLISFENTFGPATLQVLDRLCGKDRSLIKAVADAWGFDLETATFAPSSILIAGSGHDIALSLAPVLNIQDINGFVRKLDDLYGIACAETVEFLPGVREALEALSGAGYYLGIATNDAEVNAKAQMQKLQAQHLFSAIYGADSGHGAKPGGGMATAFARQNGCTARQVAMVGDSLHDLKSGRTAGCICIAVDTGPAAIQELAPFSDVAVPSVASLPEVLGAT